MTGLFLALGRSRAARRSRRTVGEHGVALVTVILGIMVIFAAVMVLAREAVAQYRDARINERDDVLLAHMEAVLDRYVAKIEIDPAYHLNWVDEFERTRTCSDVGSADFGQDRVAGDPWFEGCGSWSYDTDPAPSDWTRHPLTIDADDGEVLLEVRNRGDRGSLELTIAGQIRVRRQYRTISVDISPPSVSAFQWMSEVDLRFPPGADIEGPIYTGRDAVFNGTPAGTVRGDVYADGDIAPAPTFADGSIGFDTGGLLGGAIADVFPEPLVFDSFWDDLDLIRTSACNRGGICLQTPDATAYLLQPHMLGSTAQISVWYSTASNSLGCIEPEEWWWANAEDIANGWQAVGTFALPDNGVIWADATVILGNRGVSAPFGEVVIGAPVTIAAGDAQNVVNVVINADIAYNDASVGDVLGVVSSGDIVINPNAVGHQVPGNMTLTGAFLAQKGQMRVARSCGQWGSLQSVITSPELVFVGSIATRDTGDFVTFFPDRDFSWDQRFRDIAPPLYPRVSTTFAFVDWKEIPIPDWGRS